MTKSAALICPICQDPVTSDGKDPFCSQRCADVDLHRWLSGQYAIPDRAVSPEELDEEDITADDGAVLDDRVLNDRTLN